MSHRSRGGGLGGVWAVGTIEEGGAGVGLVAQVALVSGRWLGSGGDWEGRVVGSALLGRCWQG